VLQEWRLLREPRDTSQHQRTTAEIVPVLIKKFGVAERFAEEKISAAWKDLVGDFINRHSRPVKLERKVLTIAVLQPTVLYTLERDLKPDLLRKLKAHFGDRTVTGVRFTHG